MPCAEEHTKLYNLPSIAGKSTVILSVVQPFSIYKVFINNRSSADRGATAYVYMQVLS